MIETGEISIYEAMQKIKDGKYAVPPFQREYVWPKEKIVKLWDSILMGYPISTFLFWKYNPEIIATSNFLRFTHHAKFRSSTNGQTVAEARGVVMRNQIEEGILDGQQRLTSLYVSLIGSCSLLAKNERAESDGTPVDLYIDLTKKENDECDEDGFECVSTYELKFSGRPLRSPFFKVRDIMSDSYKNMETREETIDSVVGNLSAEKREYAKNVLNTLCRKVFDEKIIQFQNVEGEESEALEMFIRFNNGGKPLTKAEIADATITYYWEDAPENFKQVVHYRGRDVVEPEFSAYKNFGLNFIIRLGTMLFEDNVAASLGRRIIRGLNENWTKIKKTLADTSKYLSEMGIRVESYQSRWNVLLPVIYFVYSNDNYRYYKNAILAYLSRSTLLKYFQNGTTAKLTKIKKLMKEHQVQGEPVLEISLLDEINELKVTESKIEEILESKKGAPITKIALEWLNYTMSIPVSPDVHEDHLQPFSLFMYARPPMVPEADWVNWKGLCNTLPNLQFFNWHLNILKSNRELYEYYDNLEGGSKDLYQKCYLLFEVNNEEEQEILLLQNFGKFFEKRKAVIKEKLSSLLGFAVVEEDAE
ncbi:DUF262 domain-containing protein [Candidatus Saccharibacteria bacterium]|nr:DUF262 domain-containing protein [Candidatus Saccharibacteria bacterium]